MPYCFTSPPASPRLRVARHRFESPPTLMIFKDIERGVRLVGGAIFLARHRSCHWIEKSTGALPAVLAQVHRVATGCLAATRSRSVYVFTRRIALTSAVSLHVLVQPTPYTAICAD